MADGHHHAAFVVIDGAPVWLEAVLFVSPAAAQVLRARHLEALIQIEDRVENRIAVLDIHDLTVGKDLPNTFQEDFPFLSTVKIVHHQKSSAQEELAQLRRLTSGKGPVPDLDSIHGGPVEYIILAIEIHYLFNGASFDARQPPNAL